MKLYPKVTIIFCIWVISVSLISLFSFSTLPHSGVFSGPFIKSFSNWDGGHFLGIAELGYREKFQYAFFPLYPLVVKLMHQLTNNYLISSLLISIVSTFLGMQVLYKLMSKDYDKKLAEKVILAVLFFPTSFYFLTAYSEGLFFLLVILTFYFLRQNKLLQASIFAGLASATRLSGLALVLGLLVEIMVREKINKRTGLVFLSLSGFIIYCGYLYYKVGDPFYFLTAELHWQRSFTMPVINFWDSIRKLADLSFINNNFISFLDLIFAVFGLGLSIRSFRFLPLSFSIYSLVSILFPLFTPSLSSMPRFLLTIFPIFILVAQVKNQYLALAYQIISLMLLSTFAALFVNGYWVS